MLGHSSENEDLDVMADDSNHFVLPPWSLQYEGLKRARRDLHRICSDNMHPGYTKMVKVDYPHEYLLGGTSRMFNIKSLQVTTAGPASRFDMQQIDHPDQFDNTIKKS